MQKIKSLPWIRTVGIHAFVHQVVCLVCSAVLVSVTSYGIVASVTGHINVVGATLVDIELPSPEAFPLYAKPISFLMAAALGLAYSGLDLSKPNFLRFTRAQISLIKLVTYIAIAISAYEVLYNFAIWTAEISTNSLLGVLNPDVIISQFPNAKNPWNLVFATKLSTTMFAIAVYAFYFIRQIEKRRDNV